MVITRGRSGSSGLRGRLYTKNKYQIYLPGEQRVLQIRYSIGVEQAGELHACWSAKMR
jgi:hypothetical protein